MVVGRRMGLVAALGAVAAGCATEASLALKRLPDAPEALVQLRHTGCASGTCPVYGVSIFADRTVVYEGAANVAVAGQQRATISPEQMRALQLSLEETHFLDNTDECCVCPNETKKRYVVLDYRPGLVRKTVVHDQDCPAAPPAITTLERLIEGMTGVRRWAFVESGPTAPTAAATPTETTAPTALGTDEMPLRSPEVEAVSTLAAPPAGATSN